MGQDKFFILYINPPCNPPAPNPTLPDLLNRSTETQIQEVQQKNLTKSPSIPPVVAYQSFFYYLLAANTATQQCLFLWKIPSYNFWCCKLSSPYPILDQDYFAMRWLFAKRSFRVFEKFHVYLYAIRVFMEWECLTYESDSCYVPVLIKEFNNEFSRSNNLDDHNFYTQMVEMYHLSLTMEIKFPKSQRSIS